MARIRSIHPKALESRKLRKASDGAERTYWRLQVLCDDEGRCEDEPELLTAMLYPAMYLPVEAVDKWLWELSQLGLIVRFTVEAVDILQVLNFKEFQHPSHPTPSKLPGYRANSERSPEGSGGLTESAGGLPWEGSGEEGPRPTLSTTFPVDNPDRNGNLGSLTQDELSRLRSERTGRRTAT